MIKIIDDSLGCSICGQQWAAPSTLRLVCNRGSKFDGERLNLTVCGACAGKLYEAVLKEIWWIQDEVREF